MSFAKSGGDNYISIPRCPKSEGGISSDPPQDLRPWMKDLSGQKGVLNEIINGV